MTLLAQAMQRAYAAKVPSGAGVEAQSASLGAKRERDQPGLLYCSWCFKSNQSSKGCRGGDRKEAQGTAADKTKALAEGVKGGFTFVFL